MTNQPASDTPLTDAELRRIEADEKNYEDRHDCYCALVTFTRQLEERLALLSDERESERAWVREVEALCKIQSKKLVEQTIALAALRAELAMATDAANKGDEARCKAGAMQGRGDAGHD